jgi:hypothetical protein
LKPIELNIFKNGTYFIQREGTVTVKDNESSIPVPPTPLLSTFWLTCEKGAKVEQIRFFTDTLKRERLVNGIPELLNQNIGKSITLNYMLTSEEVRTVSGKLLSYDMKSGLMKMQKADGSFVVMNAVYVKEILFSQSPEMKLKADSIVRRGFVRFNKNSGSVTLRMTYMQTGIQWTPLYNIKVLNDNELQLELKATIENFMEDDIKNTNLVLTVGSPNFYYGTQLDPIATSYISSLTAGLLSTNTASYAYDNFQMISETESGAGYGDFNNYSSYNTSGTKSNDLYFYKCGAVDLPKNSKTTVMIFSKNVPYKDIYEVSIGDGVNYQSNRYVVQTDNSRQTVYHSYRLTNTTNQPFTTGPVFVLDENLMPLAQDQLKYTAVNGENSVQLARSSDVIVKYNEEEINREDNYKTINKRKYTKVTIKGEITIENLQAKDINLKVDKTVNADIVKSSDNGLYKKIGSYYGVNPVSEIKWDLNIKAGDKKTLTYTYEVLI